MTTPVRGRAGIFTLALLVFPAVAGAVDIGGPNTLGIKVATLMDGPSGGTVRDALPRDFVPSKRRDPGCRSFSTANGSTAGFMDSRLITSRPHATIHAGPGKHYCTAGHVVGRDLRLHIVAEKSGWFRIELGKVSGWVSAASLKREL